MSHSQSWYVFVFSTPAGDKWANEMCFSHCPGKYNFSPPNSNSMRIGQTRIEGSPLSLSFSLSVSFSYAVKVLLFSAFSSHNADDSRSLPITSLFSNEISVYRCKNRKKRAAGSSHALLRRGATLAKRRGLWMLQRTTPLHISERGAGKEERRWLG